MDEWVFVDTCVWASFFNKPKSRHKKAIDELIDSDRIALIGPILTEVLRGFRREDEANWVFSQLRAAHYVELGQGNWQSAATLGRRLAAGGRTLPIADLAVAVVAQRLDAAVYTTDPHFDLIAGLKRYES